MYRLFVAVGGLVVVALFAALIVPPFVDWTNYRTRLEEQASAAIGQPVRVGGPVSVRLLPLPRVTFADLTVGQDEDGRPMMTAKSFSLLAELMPLLSGEVRIVDMELVEPDLVIDVGQGGAVAWTQREETSVAPQRIAVENLAIRGGRIRIEGLAGGRKLSAANVEATVSAQSLLGPWRIAATGDFEGQGGEIEIATGKAQDNGTIRMKVAIRPDGLPYKITGDGPLALENGLLNWAGAFDLAPAARKAGTGAGAAREIAPLPVRVAGRFAATPNGVELPEFRIDVGSDPYTVNGKGRVAIREEVSFRLQADGRQIDLDRIRLPKDGQAPAGGAGLGERLATLRGVLDRVPVPGVRGRIDFLLPAIVAGDTTIREIAVVAEPEAGRWKIPSLKAVFPGNTAIEAEGVLGVGGNFGFSGRMALASRQPTGFAQWLTGQSNAALRSLGAAGFTAEVAFNDRQASLDNLELALGEATLRGKLQRLTPPAGRPAILAQLEGPTIDLDHLLAIHSLTRRDGDPALSSHDLDVELKAEKFSGLGMSARNVDLAIRVEGGAVTVNRLKAADFLGATIDSSGRLTDMLASPNGDFRLNLKAGDASALAKLALGHFGANAWLERIAADPSLSSGLDLTIEVAAQASEGRSRGTAAIDGAAGGTKLSLRDRFDGQTAEWQAARHDLTAKLEQADPARLARQLALAAVPAAAPGPLTVAAEFSGAMRSGMNVEILASAPDSDFSVSGTLRQEAGDGRNIAADLALTLGLRNADPWLILFGQPLPGIGGGNPVSLSAKLARGGDGAVRATAISGNFGGNGFSGDASVSGKSVAGRFKFDRVSGPWIAELALGAGLAQSGGSGEIELQAATFDLGGGPDGKDFSGKLVLADRTATLSDAVGTWFGGRLEGTARLAGQEGRTSIGGQFRLTGADAAALAEFSGHPGIIAGKADIAGSFDGAAGGAADVAGAVAGSGTVLIRDATIPDLSTDGLSGVLHAGDNERFEITPANVENLARQLFLKGGARFPQIADNFSLGGGKLALRNIAGENPQARLSGSAEYDLKSGETAARLTLALKSPGIAAQGEEPAVTLGFSGSAKPALDVSALEGFLSVRAFEREQRRLDLLQEMVAERQRLSMELRILKAREAGRPDAGKGVARKAETDDALKTGGTPPAGEILDLTKEIERRVLKR